MRAAPRKRPRRKPTTRTFLFAMLFYLLLVHVWGLWNLPVGGDHFGGRGRFPTLPYSLLMVYQAELPFGSDIGFRLVNLGLLYGAMVFAFLLTRHVLGAPLWLGSLVATLMIANPLKSAATLEVFGTHHLVCLLAALAGFYFFVSYCDTGTRWRLMLAFWCVLAVTLTPTPFKGLGFVLLVHALVLSRGQWPCVLAALLVALPSVAPLYSTPGLLRLVDAPQAVLTPLLLVFYPVGLLPETVDQLAAQPWRFWVQVLGWAVVIGLVLWKARSRGLLFAVLAMLVMRLTQPVSPEEDMVHLSHGADYLPIIVFGSLAVAALAQAMMRHRKWVRPAVLLTTMLCLVFFVLQWREIAAWRHAGNYVKAFQERAMLSSGQGCRVVAVIPDFQYYRTAPMMLSNALMDHTIGTPVRHNTPPDARVHYDPKVITGVLVQENAITLRGPGVAGLLPDGLRAELGYDEDGKLKDEVRIPIDQTDLPSMECWLPGAAPLLP